VGEPDTGGFSGKFATGALKIAIAARDRLFPLVHERPVDSARAEIGHVSVRPQSRDRRLD
jgi:hypothetical protein